MFVSYSHYVKLSFKSENFHYTSLYMYAFISKRAKPFKANYFVQTLVCASKW
jgi:hypothetical protein